MQENRAAPLVPARRTLQPVDAALLALTVVWGANFSIVKAGLNQMAPLAFNAVRFTGATVVMLVLTWVLEHNLSLPRREWGLVFVLGLVGHFAHLVCFITGLARTTATNSSLILAAAPIFVALLSAWGRSDRITVHNWLGILLSFLGIFLVVTATGPGLRLSNQTFVGDLLTLAATVLWALYLVLATGLVQRVSPLRATAWTMASAAPLLVLAALPDLRVLNWHVLSGATWAGMAYSGILTIGIGNIVWYAGVQKVGSAHASIYSYLTPLITVVIAWACLGETLKPMQGWGALAVLAGVALARQNETR